MKLFISETSPYARKARVVVRECGLVDKVEEIIATPHDDDPALIAQNPLGLIPVLVRADGTALYDSPVICEYLDTLTSAPALLPEKGDERWRVAKHVALADGILDFAVVVVLEKMRPAQERSEARMARAFEKISRALGEIARLTSASQNPDMGHFATACALGYMDFRHADVDWRTPHSDLAVWFDDFSTRASLRDTRPPDPST